MLTFFFLMLAGIVGGFIAGLIGIGGGIVYVFVIPIALKLMGVPDAEIAQYTVANSIFAIFFASASANYALVKLKNFHYRPVLITSLFSIISSLLTLAFIVNTDWYSVKKFNLVVVLLLIYMLIFTLISAKKNYRFPLKKIKIWQFGLVGLSSGLVASVSGLGGGIVIIPLLNSVMKVDIKKSSSISSGVIMVTSLVMTMFNLMEETRFPFSNYNMGYIVFPIGLVLAAGVIFSSPFGVRTAAKASPKTISYIYASILGIVISKKVIELIFIYK
ncbi:MAG TPA: sulfite exporter TauE/SafE family protein [Cytophagaceae bacterium]|jgi:uncharacterized membrane protein YfcA|nr:sulfite exporter TauE/SafE family protein [Cytophagaceae bacterium]